ncbi:MAG: ribosome recycling factor [Pseudomonadota bacterium]
MLNSDIEKRMQKSIDMLHHELSKLRTGRAHPSLLEHITVSYYGNDTPLSQLASITAADARTLQVQPWEKNIVPDIEKAIMQSDLGLNPATSGNVIRVPLPALTEERRKEMIKLVKAEAEKAKVAVRNIRRDVNDDSKRQVKNKTMSEDEERRVQSQVQTITDKFVNEIDNIVSQKEKDLMAI